MFRRTYSSAVCRIAEEHRAIDAHHSGTKDREITEYYSRGCFAYFGTLQNYTANWPGVYPVEPNVATDAEGIKLF